MATAGPSTEFEIILASLENLSTHEVADLVKIVVSERDWEAFDVLVGGLSLDALRFLAARTLLRHRATPA